MPARNSSMELSSPDPESTAALTRRKSGRVAQKPKVLSPSTSASGSKRKRGDADTDVEMDDGGDEEEEESSEESEGEPDPEELKERRKRAKKAGPKKPAAKKAKQTNGDTVSLAIRPAKAPRKKKPQHQTADAEAVGGLYGEFDRCAGQSTVLIDY
jgi:cohesin complex subunit SA-1/2